MSHAQGGGVACDRGRPPDRHRALPADTQSSVSAVLATPNDPIVVTDGGHRLPGAPPRDAIGPGSWPGSGETMMDVEPREMTGASVSNGHADGGIVCLPAAQNGSAIRGTPNGPSARPATPPPSHTNPLFPPLPLYGPPSFLGSLRSLLFRASSFILSLSFLGCVVVASLLSSISILLRSAFYRLTCRGSLDQQRPFYKEESRRARSREQLNRAWDRRRAPLAPDDDDDIEATADRFPPTEGGRDPIICDVGYYARRVGLDVEPFEVQTEDGFIIDLWHVYDPAEHTRLGDQDRRHRGPGIFQEPRRRFQTRGSKPPVLLIHGLLQSAGAYCCNDDSSLAFWLCKSGYDVWLGNNRCGFHPRHVRLKYGDPRMWCWNIRQFGILDLPALVSRVLFETGFDKTGLVCHSQGTTETLVALAKDQRPDLGASITVFCALAPAAYAGPLMGKVYFKFMRAIPPTAFRLVFGIHAFIPLMMQMHRILPPRVYGWLGYKVLSFLFGWSDARWDRGLRDRIFQFSPVYVSAESMRWWLGREGFAKHKCILATKTETRAEERLDMQLRESSSGVGQQQQSIEMTTLNGGNGGGTRAWYDERVPPFALWVCGNDRLVDGERLLRRLESDREPHVRVCHSKVMADYEHLDVLWAMDAEDRVFREVRQVLWDNCDVRDECRVPTGCGEAP